MKISNQGSKTDLWRQVTTFAAILGSIAINTLSNVFPLNGVSVGNLSNTLIATVISIQRQDTAYVLVIVWALVAIAIRQANTPLIVVTGWGLAVISIGINLLSQFKPRSYSSN
jgi:hypothetical protein